MAKAVKNQDPTRETYEKLNAAYHLYNDKLFGGKLPTCLITVQRKRSAYGYFASERFQIKGQKNTIDEIALNPMHFKSRTTEQVLSTLVHEMTHLEQFRFGKPSRNGYHNKEWAGLMERVGLIPSDSGHPGGKKTGQRVTHYIDPTGKFKSVTATFIKKFGELPADIWVKEKKKSKVSKVKYTCPDCELNAWAKPEARLTCTDCEQEMEEA